MKIKQIVNFLKKNVFYVAMSVVIVGAVAVIFLFPDQQGNVSDEPNPYAQNAQVDGDVTDDYINDSIIYEQATGGSEMESELENEASEVDVADEVITTNDAVASESKEPNVTSEGNTSVVSEEELGTETFESTTASGADEPFFAEGDTFIWPVEGEVVVPYTDESTKYWFSESLNQTMRTFGICIGGVEGSEVKAVAPGEVVEILEDSSTLALDIPYVKNVMVIDHGNGYRTIYGFQNGSVNKELKGQIVNTGDVLGTIGSPSGAFLTAGDNIYLQVIHNEEIVSPTSFLEAKGNADTVAEGVDIGFAK